MHETSDCGLPPGMESLIRDVLGRTDDPELAAGLCRSVSTTVHGNASATVGLAECTHGESGRFRVLRPHARGGLGEVFLARDEQLDREVALKEIRSQYAHDDDLRARFLLEAEVTGKLEHPGIVPVYGLGCHADGRPYYAMRLIRGESLMEAIDRLHGSGGGPESGLQTLDLRKLLGRFVVVCNAVAYAHSRGVIHRDLKPENIMLGPYGETLLVDWGLAKLVGRDDPPQDRHERPDADMLQRSKTAGSAPTRFGVAVGTLAYMSPEQAAGIVDQLGPASDIYSLGATLYALLTGRAPVQDGDSEAMLRDAMSGRFPPPRKFDPRIPAALEAICLKAMALNPADRYRSVRELTDDVEAWLGDEPVGAWREPLRVRIGRWMRRHRTLVSSIAAMLLVAVVSLTIGVVLLSSANRRVRESKTLAEQREEEARDSFKMALRAVDEYLTKVGEDPRLKAHGLESMRRDLLETARQFFEKFVEQEPDEPLLRAQWGQAHFRLAYVVEEIGSNREATELLEKAARVFETLAHQYPDDQSCRYYLAQAHTNLGGLYLRNGRTEDARRSFATALEIESDLTRNRPEIPEYQAGLAKIHNNLAKLHFNAGKFDRAESAYRQALATGEELVRAYPKAIEYRSDLASVYSNLAVVCNLGGRYADALAALERALEIEDRLAEEHPAEPEYRSRLAATCDRLANVRANMDGQFAAARTAYEKALALRRCLVHEHPEVARFQRDLAGSHNNLASLFGNQGLFADAEAEFEASREILGRLAARYADVPRYRNDLALTLSNLARLYDRTNRPEEALAAWAAAADARRHLVRTWPHTVAYALDLGTTCLDLGRAARQCGRMEPAVEHFAEAIAALEPIANDDAHGAAARQALWDARVERAETLGLLGRHADALADWQRAIELDDGDRRDGLRLKRAESLARAGRHEDAFRETKDLLELASGNGWVLHQLAAIRALAATAVSADESLPEAQRERLAGQYAEAALEALHRATAAGYFDDPAAVNDLSDDPRMESLRQREDFRPLIERFDAPR